MMDENAWARTASFDRRYWIYFAAILILLYSIGQLGAPFIAHDDYDWLISPSFGQGFESPWSKALSEGRWLNYLWSLISIRLSIHQAFVIYILLYSTLSIFVSKLICKRSGVLAALIVFIAPMGADTMQWPTTQIPGMTIFLLAFILINRCGDDIVKLKLFPFVMVAGFLSYPVLSPVLLLLYATSFSGEMKFAVIGLLVYVASFVAGVLVAFSLNYVFQGHFTIIPAPWRHATPLFASGTLYGNIIRYLHYYDNVKSIWPALVIGGLSYCLCFIKGIHVPQCKTLLVYGLAILGMEASLCIISGVDLPMRSSFWIWILTCAPAVMLAYDHRKPAIGFVACILLLINGVVCWQSEYANIQRIYPAMSQIGEETRQVMAANANKFDSVVTFGDANANQSMLGINSNRALRNYLFKAFRINSRPCSPELCLKIQSAIDKRGLTAPIDIIDKRLVIILSPNVGSTY